jgi:cytochrome P450
MTAAVSLAGLMSEEGRRNPFRYYAWLHERGEAVPVLPGERHAAVVHSHETVSRVLRDPDFRVLDAAFLDRSGTRWRDHLAIRTLQNSIFFAHPAKHALLRRVFGQVLTPRRVSALEPVVSRITDRLTDRLAGLAAGGTPVDFMAEFAVPLPGGVIGELFGVPELDQAWFPPRVRLFDAVLELGRRPLRQVLAANAAADELISYFARLLAERRKNPGSDLVSAVAALADGGQGQFTEAELLANLVIVFNAGFRTTSNLLGNGLALLLRQPDLLAALRADPSLAPAYAEEMLRCEPTLHFVERYAAADTEIAGVDVAAGQRVLVLMGAANRDPRWFAEPDRFDPSRHNSVTHLAFGAGAHHCFGGALARLEALTAFRRLLATFPQLTLAAPPPPRYSLSLRGYDQLLVQSAAG